MAEWATRARRDRHDTDRHAELLRAARGVFERDGIEGASVAAVTQEAQVSRATFYVYFASLDDALGAVAREVRDDLLASQRMPVQVENPIDVAAHSMEAFLDARIRNLRMLDVIESRAHHDAEMGTLWEELSEHPLRRTARYVRSLAESGIGRPAADPAAVARAAHGMVIAYASWIAADPTRRAQGVHDLNALFRRLLGIQASSSAERTADDAPVFEAGLTTGRDA